MIVLAGATSGSGIWALRRLTRQENETNSESTAVPHRIGTREEWLAARLKLLKEEKEHTRRGDELAQNRQELPWVRVERDYRFQTDDGTAALPDLFRGRSQLLIYHLMFGADYKAACPSCSAIADGFNGIQIHLAHHDVMLWAVSRAPLAKLQAYKRRLGWTFPWASSFGSDFNSDYSVGFSSDEQLIRAMRGASTASGACGSGSTARPTGATRRAIGGAATTSTTTNDRGRKWPERTKARRAT